MNHFLPLLKGISIFFCALAFASCLDTHEEVWINSDASGAARIQISVPLVSTASHGGEAGIRKMIEEYLNGTPAFSSYALETSSEESSLKIDLSVTFDNVLDLQNATSEEALEKLPTGSAKMMGRSEFEFHGLNVAFSRSVELSKAIPGALFFPKNLMEGHSITTIIHLPEPASSHNATSTADGSRTLIWATPLATALKNPVETNFTMPLPIPWLSIGLIVLLLLILVTALIYYLRRRKSKSIAA